ncbi:MAG: class II glutamine amidotransferase [Deltaproteobacteria bacterium]|nr:class II glutamine amidotransferase [Deltaproteobacteria bacterium]
MPHCFGFICNDSTLVSVAQRPYEEALTSDSAPQGWGLAYYQGGQPLMRKQPRGVEGALSFIEQSKGIKAPMIIGQVRDTPEGRNSNENTPPFRYRRWTATFCGQVDKYDEVLDELRTAIPEFIQRNIKGKSQAELIFHLFLAFLNDTGKRDDPRIPANLLARITHSTFAYLDRVVKKAGGEPRPYIFLTSNGLLMAACHREAPLYLARQTNYTDIETGPNERPISYPHLKAVMLLGGKDPEAAGWESIDDSAVVVVDDELSIDLHTA